ncbi:MAG: KpsF/GutQ family sugar-phosphate isomerase [Fimbriimonadaceae bacterium]
MGGEPLWEYDHGGADLKHSGLERVLREEGLALNALAGRLDERFDQAVDWILACGGRVVTCGVGKSGHIGQKSAATFASTGTPSFFLHAAEAVHGDLGMVTDRDIVLALTYSGETDEIVRLFPSFREIGAKTILMTGRTGSSAAREADLVLDVSVEKEACPNNLAPTTSTTAMIAACDAVAVAVMEARNFGAEDFARFHPAGALGKRLLLRVADVMRSGDELPLVDRSLSVLDLMKVVTRSGAGCACVTNENQELVGFISDGDLRRWFVNSAQPLEGSAGDLMNQTKAIIEPSLLAIEALEVFQNYPVKIGEMPVVENGRVVGLLVLKDLLRSGIV